MTQPFSRQIHRHRQLNTHIQEMVPILAAIGLSKFMGMVRLSLRLNRRLDEIAELRWNEIDYDRIETRTVLFLHRVARQAGLSLTTSYLTTGYVFDHIDRREFAASDLLAAIPTLGAQAREIEASEQYSVLFGEPCKTEPDAPRFTRLCDDPWHYVEFSASGNCKPCCVIDAGLGLDDFGGTERNGPYLRALRHELLTGQLNARCANCHLRKKVPVELMTQHHHAHRQKHRLGDLDAWPVANIRVDLTEKCNLRCVYCPVSGPSYAGKAMPDGTVQEVLEYIQKLPKNVQIHCNGHGETTFHANWQPFCETLLNDGRQLTIITNLAKAFDDREIETLSRFSHLAVSLDSDDEKMMKAIRKPTRIPKVFDDIKRIQATARAAGRRGPHISISAGIYDPSVWRLESFADTLIARGIQSVTFWNLVKYKHDKMTKPLTEFSETEFAKAQEIVGRARAKMHAGGIRTTFAGDFTGPGGVDLCK